MKQCPCGSGLDYAVCCGSFHSGAEIPATAEALMRSRYSAYVLKHSTYLLDTWHHSTRPATIDNSHGPAVWQRLEIILRDRGMAEDDEGWVEFVARYQGGQIHERSRFVKEAGHWFYVDGDLMPPLPMTKPGRNDPCSCGSGKKYKKCCG